MKDEARDTALFLALVEGELDERSSAARELLERRADLAASWRETRAVFDGLEHSSREQEAVLLEAAVIERAPGEARALEALRAAIASESPPVSVATATRPRPRRSGRLLWLVAAAVLIALGVYLWPTRPHESSRDAGILLGDFEIEPHGGLDPSTGDLVLQWTAPTLSAARFVLTIEGRDGPAEPWREVRTRPAQATGESIARATHAAWPRELRWLVVAIDAGGTEVGRSPWSHVSSR